MERLLNFLRRQRGKPKLPDHPSLPGGENRVSYENDGSIIIDPAKLPIGGPGEPIRFGGRSTRLFKTPDGGLEIRKDD
jgi:hypothetical protein